MTLLPAIVLVQQTFASSLQPDVATPEGKATPLPPPFDVDSVINAVQSPDYSIDRARAANMVSKAINENRITEKDRRKLIDAMLPLARIKEERYGSYSQPRIAIALLGNLKSTEAIPILLDRLSDIHPMFGSGLYWTVASYALYNIGEPAIGPIIEHSGIATDLEWLTLLLSLENIDKKKPLVRQMMRAYLDATVGAEAPAPVTEVEKAQRALVKSRLEKFLSTREPRRPKPKVSKSK